MTTKQLVFSLMMVSFATISGAQSTAYSGVNKIDRAETLIKEGFPKDAMAILEEEFPRIPCASYIEVYVKAHILYITALSKFEEDAIERSISHLEKVVTKCGEPASQIFHSYLGELYMNYARYHYRDKNYETSSDDISTWSYEKIQQTALSHYTASLKSPRKLHQISVADYKIILKEGKDDAMFRPTLYDLLAYRFLDQCNDKPSIAAHPELSGIMTDFIQLQWKDDKDFESLAVLTFQELLRSHIRDNNQNATVYVDLQRIAFFSKNEENNIPAWDFLIKTYQKNEASAMAVFAKAEALNRMASSNGSEENAKYDDYRTEAVKLCRTYSKKFPESYGGKQCEQLLQQISKGQILSIEVEAVLIPSKPALAGISYKNVTNLNCYLYQVEKEQASEFAKAGYGDDKKLIEFFKNNKPLNEWTVAVPDSKDYLIHHSEFEISALIKGSYYLVVTTEKNFNPEKNEFISQFLQVSSLHATFIKGTADKGLFAVVDRETGTPLKDVVIELRSLGKNAATTTLKSDKDGIAELTESFNTSIQATFTLKNDILYASNNIWQGGSATSSRKNITRCNIFTDRAVYRPGQTVYFKGILTESTENAVNPVINADIQTSIRDANYQELQLLTFKTDEFGSFDGSFTIPANVLTGNFTIRASHGSVTFLVEEYRRPRFEVTFDKLKEAYQLNENVKVTGKAMMLNGLPLENATVNYEITRYVFRPLWRYYPHSASEIVDRGAVTTKADGSFEIVFKTTADIEEKEDNFFYNFEISADVVDVTGETQNGKTNFSAGTSSVIINLVTPETIISGDNDKLEYSFTNYNGEKIPATGTVLIEELQQPKAPYIERYWQEPDVRIIPEDEFAKKFPQYRYDGKKLPVVRKVFSENIDNGISGEINLSEQLNVSGSYRITIVTKDKAGKEIKQQSEFNYIKSDDKTFPIVENGLIYIDKSQVNIGESLNIYVGSTAKNAKLLYVYSDATGRTTKEWIAVGKKLHHIEIPATYALCEGFTVYLQLVQENRIYEAQSRITVVNPNKKLNIEVSGIRDKTMPGAKERWQIKITDHEGKPAPATMFTTMYDAALDAFMPLTWSLSLSPNYRMSSIAKNGLNFTTARNYFHNINYEFYGQSSLSYSNLNWFGYSFFYSKSRGHGGPILMMDAPVASPPDQTSGNEFAADDEVMETSIVNAKADMREEAPVVSPRQNFAETAFFYPNLRTDQEGNIILEFVLPETLTRWNMKGIGYTKKLQIGEFNQSIVTESDFMVMPNLPRFLRVGDDCIFTARIANKTDKPLHGTAKIVVENAKTGDILMENILSDLETPFTMKGNESIIVSWNYSQPNDADALIIRITATSGNLTDGEEHLIPVLPSEVVALESVPIEMTKAGTQTYTLKNLNDVDVAQKLTLEMSTSPVWYAIQALPVLAEYPNESSDQVFNRYYSSVLGSYILNSMPQIKQVFDQWRTLDPDAFLSNLEKNQELKNLLLTETPWVMEAQNETARKQRLATLFEINKLGYMQQQAIAKLRQMMLDNGAFPWFPDMKESEYITRYIVTGIGKLKLLGLHNRDLDFVVNQSVNYLDEKWLENYNKVIRSGKTYAPSGNDIAYLYARSFFIEKQYNENLKNAVYPIFDDLAKLQSSFEFNSRAMLALVFYRNGREQDAQTVAKSLDNSSLGNDNIGKYWRSQQGDLKASGIELSALMVEIYNEVLQNKTASSQVITWLLRNKRTNDWLTPVATADAVYALISSSEKVLEPASISIKVGDDIAISSDQYGQEAGTGHFKIVYDKEAITSDMKNISVTSADDKQIWGGAYLQYITPLDRIAGDNNAPLTVNREIYKQEGNHWTPVTSKMFLEVGDKISVRFIIKADRDFEYVHLHDMRAAAFEPVNQISGYVWDQLGYYKSVRDASINLFFDRIPRGTWSIDYELFVTQKGTFSNGFSTIQCLYAPEFSNNGDGIKISVE
jgi:uncharacterized protein YfaS (alpha-2-macroglobulin family)